MCLLGMAEKLQYPCLTMIRIKIIAAFFVVVLFACNSDETVQASPSPGVLQEMEQGTWDTSQLVTDSVVMRDSNTADIESMKKIN